MKKKKKVNSEKQSDGMEQSDKMEQLDWKTKTILTRASQSSLSQY